MTAPVETTAAMTPPAEQQDPAEAAVSPAGAGARGGSTGGAVAQAAGRRELSQNAVIALFGGLVVTLLGVLIGLMMWQFDSLGARIDDNGARIDRLGIELRQELRAELRAEIGGVRADMRDLEARLRAEMQAGFREVNVVLLDHTDRLARLEAAAGLSREGS
ncbi:MAG: hypothetical protein OXM54_17840 [Acidimicrobiaceae bacterium]|nr:hypothetical protein [Acidimicrobiaceae bacterium]